LKLKCPACKASLNVNVTTGTAERCGGGDKKRLGRVCENCGQDQAVAAVGRPVRWVCRNCFSVWLDGMRPALRGVFFPVGGGP
jgi:methionyl-tRNA synthetase